MKPAKTRIAGRKNALVYFLPLLGFGLVILLRPLLMVLGEHLPLCPFNQMTGYYCPGCGNTRSVMALLNFDILTSLQYNIAPFLLLLTGILGYLELLVQCFGKTVHLIPRNSKVNFTLLGLIILYYLARNFVPGLLP